MKRRQKRKKPTPNRRNNTNSSSLTPTTSNNAISKIARQSDESAQSIEQRLELIKHSHYEGPIPHPELLNGYRDIIPDAPERILKVFEDDSVHARDIQIRALEAQKQDNRRVHWMAWTLVVGGYVLSAYFAHINKDYLAYTILGLTLAGTITGFLQNKENK